MTKLVKKLNKIQLELNAPKNQRNKFGGYNYRSLESILESLKPLLKETECVLTIDDDIIISNNLESEYIVINKEPVEVQTHRVYIKSTATLRCGDETISSTAFARETSNKTGMDSGQLTGSTSSYARKYAVNGLFAIDDNKDADSMDNGNNYEFKKPSIEMMTIGQTNQIKDLIKHQSDDIKSKTNEWLNNKQTKTGADKMITRLQSMNHDSAIHESLLKTGMSEFSLEKEDAIKKINELSELFNAKKYTDLNIDSAIILKEKIEGGEFNG